MIDLVVCHRMWGRYLNSNPSVHLCFWHVPRYICCQLHERFLYVPDREQGLFAMKQNASPIIWTFALVIAQYNPQFRKPAVNHYKKTVHHTSSHSQRGHEKIRGAPSRDIMGFPQGIINHLKSQIVRTVVNPIMPYLAVWLVTSNYSITGGQY